MKGIYEDRALEDLKNNVEENEDESANPTFILQKAEQDDLCFLKSKWPSVKIKQFLSYPQFYQDININIDIPNLEDEPQKSCSFKFCNTLSALGSVPEFNCAKTSKFRLLNFDESVSTPNIGSQGPVSLDKKIDKFVSDVDFDIVVQLSTMNKLMDYLSWRSGWDIPVIIKNYDIGSTKKKVVFIDKAVLIPFVPVREIREEHMKKLIKRTYCCSSSRQVSKERISNLFAPRHEASEVVGFEKNNLVTDYENKCFAKNTIYNLWNMSTGETDNDTEKPKELKILMRCKLDAYDPEEKRGISYFPKVSKTLDSKQLIKRWTSLFFRPNSLLYDMHIAGNKFVIGLVKLQLDDLNEIAKKNFNFKPESKFLVVSKIFEELMKHESGSYILHYTGAPSPCITLFKSLRMGDTPDFGNIFDLYDEYHYNGFYIMMS